MSGLTTQNLAYVQALPHWDLVDDLMAGTTAMHRRRRQYLPMSPNEPLDNYESRASLAYLEPAYQTAVENHVGRAFAQSPTITTDLPQDWIEDFDLAGNHAARVMRGAFRDAIHYGICYLLADTTNVTSSRPSLYDQRRYNIRPYCIHIPTRDLFAWQCAIVNGRLSLTQVRYWENDFAPGQDEFTQNPRRRVRVLDIGRWRLFEENGDLVGEGKTGLDYLPLVAVNVNPVGFMAARPLMESLAHINRAHYQSVADQRYIVHFSRVPIPVFTGMNDDPVEIAVGPGVAVHLPTGASFQFVETSGIPSNVGSQDIKALEDKMARLALEPLIPTGVSGDRTATEAMVGETNTKSRLESAALVFADGIERILGYMADLGGQRVQNTGVVDIKSNFAIAQNTADVPNLISAVEKGMITHRTFLIESKRRTFLSDDLDVEAELQNVEAEKEQKAAEALAIMAAAPAAQEPGLNRDVTAEQ